MEEKKLTGYPSIDKPWLKYYTEEAINATLPECTIYEYLWDNNKDHLNDVALIYFGRKITYKTIFENIEKTASAFTSLGISKGDIVTIQSLSLPQVIYMLYALSKIGAVANLIYVTSTPNEVVNHLTQTKSKLYVVVDSIYKNFGTDVTTPYLKNIIFLSVSDEMNLLYKTGYSLTNSPLKQNIGGICWKGFLKNASKYVVPVTGRSSNIVAMVYTGGTTGKSKAVMLSNFNLNVGALQYFLLGYERSKTFLSVLPPFIAFGITVTMHMPLSFGLKTILGISADPTNIAGFVEKYQPNYIICGTAQAEKLMLSLNKKKVDLSSLICFGVGGDSLSPKLEKDLNLFLLNHGSTIKVCQGYAMSETSASAAGSSYTPFVVVGKQGTIGVPFVYTNLKVIDTETKKELSYGKRGEICISSPCVMMGYFNEDEETSNILKRHDDGLLWVHSGDIGSIDEDGFISIVGRSKRMILTFESNFYYKVFPKLLEDEYAKCSCIKAISIVGRGRADDSLVNDLIAFAVLEDGVSEAAALEELQTFAQEHFESYECPQKYIFIDKLPRTTIGKVDYRALEKEAAKE